MKLRISADLALPSSAQTQTVVVYGGKGMGKTNFGSVLVEELAKQDLRFSVIDPLDVWWGLQHGAAKGGRGLDVVILGGPHGDIPIEPGAGAVVADFVADESASTVIVLRKANGEMWTNGERIQFATAYAARLFKRQGERRIPLMQVIDEAGRFVPQLAARGDREIAECVGAIEQLVEWGRNVGIGVCLITQRSARMAKAVSELADCMVAFRTVGPRSIEAVVDWFGEHVPKDRQKVLIEQLRSLERGTALVVSPGWLGFEGVARMRARETFDSSATPQAGKSLRAPGQATKPDLEKYRERMAATIERAKADDPKALRAAIAERDRRLTELERDMKAAVSRQFVSDPKEIERAITEARQETGELADRRLAEIVKRIQRNHSEAAARFDAAREEISTALHKAQAALADAASLLRQPIDLVAEGIARQVESWPARQSASPGAAGPRGSVAALRLPRTSPATSRFSSSSEAGKQEVGRRSPTTTVRPAAREGNAVAAQPSAGLDGPMQRVLDALAWLEAAGVGEPYSRPQVAFLARYAPGTGAFQNALGRCSSAGLVSYPSPGFVALTDDGRAAAQHPDAPGDAAEIQARVLERVDGPMRRCLEPLLRAYPRAMTREQLAEAAGYQAGTGAFQNALGRLRTVGAIDYPDRGHAVALPWLFLEEG